MIYYQQSTTESLSGADRIIFWPSGLGREEGWIVGWCSDDIWLVAGIVGCDKLEDLTQKIDFLGANTCFCCSCNRDPNKLPTVQRATKLLPILQVSPEQVPVYIATSGSSAITPFRQVVVYNLCLDESLTLENAVLYTPANVNSRFSQNILGRISHANAVIQAIHLTGQVLPSNLPDDRAKASVEEKTLERLSDAVKSNLVSLPFQSYFLEHAQNAPLFVRILRALVNASQAKTCVNGYCTKCEKQYHTLVQSHYFSVNQSISLLDDTIGWAMDLLLGVLMCFVLSSFGRDLFAAFTTIVERHFHWLRMLLNWMESFPIGFKLNVKLTIAMGKAAKACLNVQETFLGRFFDLGTYVSGKPFLFWSLGGLAGGSGMLTLFCDVWRLTTLHLELFVLRSSWRLFRGKKRNILRQRTDTMNYDSTQLLFGTILFTAALFLFTTVMVYGAVFFYFASLPSILHRFRWGRVWLRLVKPNWFVVGAHLMDASHTKECQPPENTDLTKLVPELEPLFFLVPRHALQNHKF